MIMHTLASGSPLPGFLNSLTGPLNHYGCWPSCSSS
jgi:hypothetical protein